MYIYCANWLKVICQEQINRLLVVVHHENIHELASKIPKSKSGMSEHKNGKKNIWRFIFLFHVLNHHHALDTTIVSIAAVFLIAAAIVIVTHGQKTLHWQ